MSALAPALLVLRNPSSCGSVDPTTEARRTINTAADPRVARNEGKSNPFFATSLQLYLRGHRTLVASEIPPYTHRSNARPCDLAQHTFHPAGLPRPDLKQHPSARYYAAQLRDHLSVNFEPVRSPI